MKFNVLQASVRAYQRNLNTHSSYKAFRQARAKLRDEGKNQLTAILESSALRLRPILMTSISTIIGVLPLVISSGPGEASRLSVGITIFAGMIFSTFFTLYVIPTVYTIVGKNTQRIDAVEIELNKQLKK